MSTRTVTVHRLLAEALDQHDIGDRVLALTVKVWECAHCDDTHISVEAYDDKEGFGVGFDVQLEADVEPDLDVAAAIWDRTAELLTEARAQTEKAEQQAEPTPAPMPKPDSFGLNRAQRGSGL